MVGVHVGVRWSMNKAIANLGCGVGIALAVASAAAQTGQPSAASRVAPASRIFRTDIPANRREANRILGIVIDSRRTPIAHAALRLRNLLNGAVVQETVTDDNGQYTFVVEESGTYLVELIAQGAVVEISAAVTVIGGEMVRTVVQTRGRWDAARQTVVPEPSMARFLGVSAADTMTAGTMTTAAALGVKAVYGGEPVSAQ